MLIGSAFPSFSWFIAPLCHRSVLFHPLVLLTQLSISARGLNCLFYLCRNVAWTKLQPHQFPLAIILTVFGINVCSSLLVSALCCLPISSQNRRWKSGELETSVSPWHHCFLASLQRKSSCLFFESPQPLTLLWLSLLSLVPLLTPWPPFSSCSHS